MALFTALRLAL